MVFSFVIFLSLQRTSFIFSRSVKSIHKNDEEPSKLSHFVYHVTKDNTTFATFSSFLLKHFQV